MSPLGFDTCSILAWLAEGRNWDTEQPPDTLFVWSKPKSGVCATVTGKPWTAGSQLGWCERIWSEKAQTPMMGKMNDVTDSRGVRLHYLVMPFFFCFSFTSKYLKCPKSYHWNNQPKDSFPETIKKIVCHIAWKKVWPHYANNFQILSENPSLCYFSLLKVL